MTKNKLQITSTQNICLINTRKKIDELNNPDSIKTLASASFQIIPSQIGLIPTIKFSPNPNYIKADIRSSANLDNPLHNQKLNEIRLSHGYRPLKNRSARNWNSTWFNFAKKLKKNMLLVVYANILFPEAVKMTSDIILKEHPELKELAKQFPNTYPNQDIIKENKEVKEDKKEVKRAYED